MNETIVCSSCGAAMKYQIKGSTQGYFCTECNASLVRTYMPEIATDFTQYKILLLKANIKSREHLSAISKVSGINLLQARKLGLTERPVLFEGRAQKVVEMKDRLDEAGVTYQIQPDFSY